MQNKKKLNYSSLEEPERPHPTAQNTCLTAYCVLFKQTDHVL